MFGIFAVSTLTPFLAFPTIPMEQEQPQEIQQEVQQEAQMEIQEEFQKEFQKESIIHNGYATDSVIQDYVSYAYDIGGIDFVKMIECENGRWDPKRVSKTHDHGLCQLNYKFNKKFINSSDFNDPYKQLDYCYEKYKINPDLRYGPDRRIDGEKCSDYVSDRFEIIMI